MTMKKTELEKRKGLAITNAQRNAGNKFGRPAEELVDKRARRERDRAAGLVPFAVKLPAALVTQLQARAQQQGVDLNEVTAQLLSAGLAA